MAGLLKSRTLSVSIGCDLQTVYEFVSNLENLPQWAKTFCRSVKQSGGGWVIDTPHGPMKISIAGKNEAGIVDHCVSPAPGVEIFVPMRVVRNGAGSEVLFTVFQQLGMSDEQYAEDIGLVEQDLATLKRTLEA